MIRSSAFDISRASMGRVVSPAPDWLEIGTSADALSCMRDHPAFEAAVLEAAAGMIDLYNGNRVLNRVMNDRARALFVVIALYLHAEPDESGTRLTSARLIAFCDQTKICSRGRAKAMLALLRWAGYLQPGDVADDRRVRPLVPTPALFALVERRWRCFYEAIALVRPECGMLLGAIQRPTFALALAVALGQAFRSGFRVLQYTPTLGFLADRDGGIIVLLALFVGQERQQPPLAIAALARQFHLSRAQILDLLRDAEERGMLSRGDAQVMLLPASRDSFAEFFCTVFVLLACAGLRALEIEKESL